jgi:hypothetical protein
MSTSPSPAATPIATTTAGLRGAHWNTDRMPAGVTMTAHSLTTADGANVTGYLFRRGGERTVVCAMHPREMLVTQYLVPEILQAGCAVWVQGARSVGNDIRLEHESAIVDLAAGQHLRSVSCRGLPGVARSRRSTRSKRTLPRLSASRAHRPANPLISPKRPSRYPTASFSSPRIWAKADC